MNTGLRDLARFGEMMRSGGQFNGQQIMPVSVIRDIQRGGNQDHLAKAGYKQLDGWSY